MAKRQVGLGDEYGKQPTRNMDAPARGECKVHSNRKKTPPQTLEEWVKHAEAK